MKIEKTWLTVQFTHGKAGIELTLNYKDKSYSMTHGNNDENVLFTSKADDNDIQKSFDRVMCVTSALKFAKSELNL